MAQGLDVIMTDLPALRSVAEGYAGADFVPAADVEAIAAALERAAHRPPRRSEPLGDWTRTVKAYRDLLAET
jgi:glycosyltransferase involved in cell wall biosynthesis